MKKSDLIYIIKETIQNVLNERDLEYLNFLVKTIKGNRVIASYELGGDDVTPSIDELEKISQKYNLEYEFLKYPKVKKESEHIIFYNSSTPNIKNIIKLYTKYLKSTNQSDLPEKLHRILGKAFGYSEEDIDWFIDQLGYNNEEEKVDSSGMSLTMKKNIEKEAKHRNMSVEEFILKINKDLKKVYLDSYTSEEKHGNFKKIWDLYPKESLSITDNQMTKIFFDYVLKNGPDPWRNWPKNTLFKGYNK